MAEQMIGIDDSFDLDEGGVAGFIDRLPLTLQQIGLIIASIVVIIGSLVPWREIERTSGDPAIVTQKGTDSFAGMLVLIAAIALLVLAIGAGQKWVAYVAAPVAGLISLYIIITWFLGLLDDDRGVLTSTLGLLAGLGFTALVVMIVYSSGMGRAKWIIGFLAALIAIIGLYNGMIADIESLDGKVIASNVKIGIPLIIFGGIAAFILRPRLD